MLVLRSVRRLPRPTVQRRGYLTDSFLDLATALPYPASWPAYSSTIILVTILGRFGILPVTIWANRRMIRYQTKVIPEVKAMIPQIQHEELSKMKAEKFPGDKPVWVKEISKRTRSIVETRRKELAARHKCRKLPTLIVPAVTQLSLFIPSSYFFASLATNPFSPFEAESFMSLASLSHPDETLFLPIAVGLFTFANAEASTWFMSANDRQALAVQRAKRVEDAKNGVRTFVPADVTTNALRIVSVARIVFASQAPGAVVLYWTVSSIFGLLQTWGMEFTRRKALDSLPQSVPPLVNAKDKVLPAPVRSRNKPK